MTVKLNKDWCFFTDDMGILSNYQLCEWVCKNTWDNLRKTLEWWDEIDFIYCDDEGKCVKNRILNIQRDLNNKKK